MDERIIQCKELKKEYKKRRLLAGLGWKITGWSFLFLCLLAGCITLFVLGHGLSFVQAVDKVVWQPVKASLGAGIPYAMIWDLAEDYGILITAATAVIWIVSFILAAAGKAKVKHTDAYRNYRTMKLTLETEKEEQ